MRILITGISGWTGQHLARLLAERQPRARILGLAWGPDQADLPATIPVQQADLTDAEATAAAVQQCSPQHIYHLAAAVGPIWAADAQRALVVNVMGTANLLSAASRLAQPPRVLVVSSAAVYGQSGHNPIPETAPRRPLSMYGISKVAQDMLAYQAYVVHNLETIRVRTFNQTGPGEPSHLVGGSIASQIARAEAGLAGPVVRVGNLMPERDITDVRDVVRGYMLAMQSGVPGEVYNLACGRAWPIRHLLESLLARSRVPLRVEQRQGLQRREEISRQVGDPARLQRATGWRAEIPLDRSLADLLQSWRVRVARETADGS